MMRDQKNIIAVRIYLGLNATPMAEFKTVDGVLETIQWNDYKQRKEFMPYITAYTLFYDERPKRDWDQW